MGAVGGGAAGGGGAAPGTPGAGGAGAGGGAAASAGGMFGEWGGRARCRAVALRKEGLMPDRGRMQ